MIEIDIAPNLFSGDFLQSLTISWHGFFSFVAVATAVILVGRWAPLRGIEPDAVYSIAIWAIIGGVVGARVVHVIDNWPELYQDNPIQVFYVWNGGIGIWGGILGGFIGGAAYAKIAKYPIGVIADMTAPALLFVQSIGRLGDIVNGEHCSKATDFILGFQWINPSTAARVCSDGFENAVQPAIVYEMLWNMMALLIILAAEEQAEAGRDALRPVSCPVLAGTVRDQLRQGRQDMGPGNAGGALYRPAGAGYHRAAARYQSADRGEGRAGSGRDRAGHQGGAPAPHPDELTLPSTLKAGSRAR